MSQEDSISFNQVTIVGPGLLGGSIGMGLKEKGMAKEIWAYLRDEKKRKICASTTWCDRAVVDLQESVQQSDLVVLCTPVETILDQLSELCKWVKPGCLITDVGSLKKEICQCGQKWFNNQSSFFVGSHPMTGSEKVGIQFASPEILKNKNCILTPTGELNSAQCQRVAKMWQKLGMQVTKITPEIHDEIVGWISHLPHIVASCLINTLRKKDEKWMNLCGNGLKDTTRIASGNPEMWEQIIVGNKDNIIAGLENMVEELNGIKRLLETENRDKIMTVLDSAKKIRDRLK